MLLVLALGASGIFRNLAMYGVIHADAQGYYGYLVALFLENSFDWGQVIDSYSATYFNADAADFTVQSELGRINKYYAGTALLILPFFLMSWLAASVLGFPVDGYSQPFQAGAVLAAIFYIGLGLMLLVKFLERKGIRWSIASFVSVTSFLATGLFHYSISEPYMSHAYSFFLFAAFMLIADRMFKDPTVKRIIALAAVFGLIVLVRPSNGLILFSAPFIAGGWAEFRSFLVSKAMKDGLVYASLMVVVVVGIQAIMYNAQVGNPIVWSYKEEGFNFLDPEIINLLFSYKKGLFIYYPVTILATIGLLFYLVKNPKKGAWLWLFLGLSVYVISSWWNWYYGGSFGMRALLEYLPFFAFGLAYLLEKCTGSVRWMLVVLVLLTAPVNLVQSYQYNKFILHWDQMNAERYWKVFLKTDKKLEGVFYRQPRVISMPDSASILHVFTLYNDFEGEIETAVSQDSTTSYSGENRTAVSAESKFGWPVFKKINELGPSGSKLIYISFMTWSEEAVPNLSFGYSYRTQESEYGHTYIAVGQYIEEAKKWTKVEELVPFKEGTSPDDTWVIYPYSETAKVVYIDDLEYRIITLKE